MRTTFCTKQSPFGERKTTLQLRLIKAPFGKRCNAPRKEDGTFRWEPYKTIVVDECERLAYYGITDGEKFTKYFCKKHKPSIPSEAARKREERKIRKRLKRAGMTVRTVTPSPLLEPEAPTLLRPPEKRIILP